MKFLSIDEMKVSTLVICLFVSISIASYGYIHNGDITNNLLILNEFLIGSIAGVNAVNMIGTAYTNAKNNENSQNIQTEESQKPLI